MHAIDRDFWLEDLDAVLTGNGVTGAVIVQASNQSQETLDLLTADLPPSVASIVGWADLDAPGAAAALDDLLALPNGPLLSGLRHLVHIDPDPHWLRRSSVSRGLDSLEKAGLAFDLVVTPAQLADCAVVASEHPGLTFVLDHLAKPPLRSADISAWEAGLRSLAALPNVYAKISGLTMETDWEAWTLGELERPISIALDCFGPRRLMFGSDWPIVDVCGGYAAWLAAARSLTAALSAPERDAIYFHTACAAYRVGEGADG